MYVLQDWTFTPGAAGAGTIEVPGLFSFEEFAVVTNLERNVALFDPANPDLSATWEQSLGETTILTLAQPTDFCQSGDPLQILMNALAPAIGPGPATNVAVTNWPTSQNVNGTVEISNVTGGHIDVEVMNWPATQPVSGTVGVTGSVSVSNFPATQPVSGSVNVGNLPASFEVSNDSGSPLSVSGTVTVGNFPSTQPVSGSVSVSNFPATQAVTGTFFQATQPVSGSVSVSNFPATQPVSGTVTANQGTSPWVTSVNNFPSSQSVTQGTSPWVVSGTTSSNVASFPSTSVDAFGRLRVSEPFTLFDSSFRYGDTALWSTATSTGGTAVFNTAQGLMDLNVTTANGSAVRRQTTKVFSYQPGKSLLVMTTFVCATPKANLDQKIGYYSSYNGYFLEQDGLTTYFVERSAVSGAVTNTRVAQSAWNVDPMNGTGPSGITLDITKSQILWMDIEWLGVGTVKMGFVIDGTFYICHAWDHANLIASTYITTASLPLSCEIVNTGVTASISTFKQICSTVISEGGYGLTGLQQSVGTPITAAKVLATAGTFYPVVSLRLKDTRLDAIAILTAVSILGNGNNETFRWEVRGNGVTTGGSWVSAGATSSVEYNLTGTNYTGGRILAAGYTSSSNQGSPSVDILKAALFANQLERDALAGTPYEISVVMAGAANATSCFASADWEEVSR